MSEPIRRRRKAPTEPKRPRYDLHPAEQYVEDVLSGVVVAGRWVKLACRRHRTDLRLGGERGLWFDGQAAQGVIDYFKFLHHSKGEWAGEEFELEPWEQFIIWALFGWKRGDGFRRFRTGYLEISRKNGKTTLLAGIGLYLFSADEESGAEVYTAATKRDQAIISHAEATRMVRSSPDLRSFIKVFKNNLSIDFTASKFEPLGKDADSSDGLNIHGALIDELHAHKTRDLWDVLETATGSRRQPLQLTITTAGFDKESICWEQHEYVEKILKGTIQDDSYFGIIYSIDEGDDWKDEKNWIKANPNLGVSVKLDDLRRKALKAKEMPAALNNFLRKHLDVWVQQSVRAIDIEVWDENFAYEIKEHELKARLCYGGLDLSSVSDLTAWVMIFPDEADSERIDVLARFWCPEARLTDSANRYRANYEAWHNEGYLMTTPGDAIDYTVVREQVLLDAQTFNIDSLNVDRLFQGYQMAMELSDALSTGRDERVGTIGMGFYGMAGPVLDFEKKLLNRTINHGGNPVMRWMADNLAFREDPAGNRKPDKVTSQGKIDGIVALLMALDRAMRKEVGKSIYETRGLLSI